MAYYRPQAQLRQAALGHAGAVAADLAGAGGGSSRGIALLFIDVQNYNCHRQGAIYQALSPEQRESPDMPYFLGRVEEVCIPNWVTLQRAARAARAEVMYTVIQSLTADGRDRSLDYRLSGFHVPPGSWDAQVLGCVAPGADEMVLPKTSSSVFQSTSLHYLLGNMGIRQLILVGCVTDQCVEHAVRDACDLGYLVTLVPDACATYSEARQAASLAAVAGYCRQRSTAEVVEELSRLQQAAECGRTEA